MTDWIENTVGILFEFGSRSQKGELLSSREWAYKIFNQPTDLPCRTCRGHGQKAKFGSLSGKGVDSTCPTCHGTGKASILQVLEMVEKGDLVYRPIPSYRPTSGG